LLYLLTPWSRVLLEKLTGLQLVKKFPAFHGTRRFITTPTRGRHLSLSWASPIQSIYPPPTSWRSILILSIHLCLGLTSDLFPSGFPTKEFAILSQRLCVATEDKHEIPQSGQAVPLPKLDPGISPMQIRNVISSANSFAGAVVRGKVLGALGLLMKVCK